jgi:VanZ family protein
VPRTLPRLAFAVCLIAVLTLSLLPNEEAARFSTGWDKSNHLLAFGVLAVLGRFGWPTSPIPIFAGLAGFALLIEVLQGMTPWRSADPMDVLADMVGLALGGVVYRVTAALKTRSGPQA